MTLMAFASVQRFAAMFGEQGPLVELQLTLGACIKLAAALMTLLLPLLMKSACTLFAAKGIILGVLCDLVTTQLQLLSELGRTMWARVFARRLVCFAYMSLHVTVGCEHFVAFGQGTFYGLLRCLWAFVCATNMTLKMTQYRINLITALVGAGMFFL